MPVFDFSNTPDEKKDAVCTYETFHSNESVPSAEHPIMVLDNTKKQWKHHSSGVFTNPIKRTSFAFDEEEGTISADIIRIDARFTSLLRWLGENHINVRLSGENREDGYAVYKIREIAFGGGTKLSAEDGFLQFMIERLLASSAPTEEIDEDEQEEEGDDMKLTSLQSITDFMTCAGRTLPDNIRLWARRNLAVARSNEVSPEERRHAQRALSIMMNIQWKSNYFEAIDPQEARRILDEELYGMERVKQRIIETIIQINRTHTLPAYGLLLVGPAGTGKSQIQTGIGFFDHMLEGFSKHGFFDLNLSCDGDLIVDSHHTIEDSGIVLGNAIREAIGDKSGIRRFGSCILPMDESLVLCAVDLSGRPYLVFDGEFTTERIGQMDTEMIKEFFYAVSYSAGMNLHIKVLSPGNNHHMAEAMFKSFARALDEATTMDPRIQGILSTKGSL